MHNLTFSALFLVVALVVVVVVVDVVDVVVVVIALVVVVLFEVACKLNDGNFHVVVDSVFERVVNQSSINVVVDVVVVIAAAVSF